MGDDVLADLTAEQAHLAAVLADLDGPAWDLPTRSPDWRIRDQIGHLAYYDEQALFAATAPHEFTGTTAEMLKDPDAFGVAAEAIGQSLTGPALLRRWRTASAATEPALRALPEGARLPWYGPPMSVRSFVTARLMETWAHGTDVVDALQDAGVDVEPSATDRLRHVCHLGAITRGWSYSVRGLEPAPEPVYVDLTLPSGEPWALGDPSSTSSVVGTAADFCLVVTQRRNVADTDLDVRGATAEEWMRMAQCFAGNPTLPPAPR